MFKLFVFCLLIAVAYGAVSTINTNLRAYHTRPVVVAGYGGWDGGRGDGGYGGGLGGGWGRGYGRGDLD
ncbi:hypothetical protein QE152_g21734 [Popillia japonica]|uniref:Glycine-rich protein n=1 Tax=Popillia japonica TaxID=7064 RepID=A0AAW1KKU3_POPJA